MQFIPFKQLMKIFAIGIACLAILLICICVTPAQQVLVDQSYLDSSTKSFKENIANREVVLAQDLEITALEAARKADVASLFAKDELLMAMVRQKNVENDLIRSLQEQNRTLAALKCDESKVTLLFIVKFSKKRCR
jgi:hypothetical protein